MQSQKATFLILVVGFLVLAGCDKPASTEVVAQTQQEQSEKSAGESDTQSPSGQKGETTEAASAETQAEKSDSPAEKKAENDSTSLFDGKTLEGWEKIEFGGEGDIEIVDGAIRMYAGDPLTGICVAEDVELPKANYEFSLEGMKLEGVDFFASITFPVNETFCTLVVGGWGGTLVGLSNLDGLDASENDTKLRKKFEKDKWYKVRVKVLPDRISAWIDDEQVVDQSIEGVEVSIRNDVISTTPLGITNFITSSQLRNIRIRNLK